VVVRRSKLAIVCDALNRFDVRFVVVGAQALILWGGARTTRDIDILIEPTVENAQRVLDALADLGFVIVRDIRAEDMASRPVTMIGDLYHVDVFTVAWSVRYAEARLQAHEFVIEETSIPAASLKHLIASKRTGRLQDAADIEVLEEILRLRSS